MARFGLGARPLGTARVLVFVHLLVTHEVEVGHWEALGLIDLEPGERVGAAIARLDHRVLPGVFRLIELEGPGWAELELASDGVVVES